ncbi:MAG TPA: pitrilysin family protein [Burkholderiales bacterium]|nr:pitrilysin family protein [Burkholderiales bacterium]
MSLALDFPVNISDAHLIRRIATGKAILVPLLAGMLFALSLPALAALEIESWTTENGARVLYLESRVLPIVDVSIEFPAGSSRDQPGMSGLASMTLAMMRKGTRSFDENQISEQLAGIGARLSSTFNPDRSGFALRTLSDADIRAPALDVLREILVSPGFPEAILERDKARNIAFIEESQTRPNVIVAQTFQQQLYGSHPYGLIGSGNPETITALTRDDLLDFHRRFFVSDEAVVVIVGDVSRDEAQWIARDLTNGLPQASSALSDLPEVPELAESIEVVIPHSASQAHIRLGMPGVSRGDPDYFALWLAAQILGGGGMTSMLNDELREKRGLTYSAYSYFSPYLRRGPFVISLQTRKDQAWEALDVALATLEKLVDEGPTEAQLQAAKRYVIGGFALNIDSNAELASYLAMIGFYRLPLDYIDRFPEEIEKVTMQQIRDALGRRLAPSRTVTVVVGPTAKP